MDVKRHIFRNYDIRGVYPDDLNGEVAYHIGRGLGAYYSKKDLKSVVMGRDNRHTSPELVERLSKGLVESGCDVTFIGISLTPTIHFLTCTHDFDVGINVTASHNPKNYNGFRLDFANAKSFFGEELALVHDIILREDYVDGKGSFVEKDLSKEYVDFFVNKFKFKSHPKVILNCGGGATSIIATDIFEKIGVNMVPLYCKFDPEFTHNVPDPENAEFMKQVGDLVLENKADVGFGFDADGDRFGMVDEKGNTYTTDRALQLFAKYILSKKPGSTVLFDIKSSKVVEETIQEYGGVPKMLRTGHPYFEEDMRKLNTFVGAELSGHVFFGDDYYGFDDGVYAACMVLKILDESKKPLSQLMSEFPVRVSTPEVKIQCPEDKKFKVVEELKPLIEEQFGIQNVVKIDGLRVTVSATGWFLIRASNTSPYLSIRTEGKDTAEVENLIKTVVTLLSQFDFLNLQNMSLLS